MRAFIVLIGATLVATAAVAKDPDLHASQTNEKAVRKYCGTHLQTSDDFWMHAELRIRAA